MARDQVVLQHTINWDQLGQALASLAETERILIRVGDPDRAQHLHYVSTIINSIQQKGLEDYGTDRVMATAIRPPVVDDRFQDFDEEMVDEN